jgi:hypothetical protein
MAEHRTLIGAHLATVVPTAVKVDILPSGPLRRARRPVSTAGETPAPTTRSHCLRTSFVVAFCALLLREQDAKVIHQASTMVYRGYYLALAATGKAFCPPKFRVIPGSSALRVTLKDRALEGA